MTESLTVLRGGHILTQDPALGELVGDIALRGQRIEYVGPALDVDDRDATVIDVTGKVVLPGFVDAHVHAWEGAFRGTAPDADFGAYMGLTQSGLVPLMSPDDVAIGERITAAQALNGGVTTFVDCCHNNATPEHSDAAIEALLATGIRAVHAVGSPMAGAAQLPEDLLRLRDKYFSSADQLLTLRMFHVIPTQASWEFAARHELASVNEIGPWVPELDALFATGLMGPHHSFNHCAGLTRQQWRAIADAGVTVNMVPRSDSYFGLGEIIPVIEAQRHGVEVGISCDNEIDYGYDMFTEMRVFQTLQRGLSFAATARGEADVPAPLGVRDVLRAATVGGARNAGLLDSVGSLTPGKKADVIVLDLDTVPTRPVGSVPGAVVNFASAANVDTVFVDGVVRKRAGELVGVDYHALATQAETVRDVLTPKLAQNEA